MVDKLLTVLHAGEPSQPLCAGFLAPACPARTALNSEALELLQCQLRARETLCCGPLLQPLLVWCCTCIAPAKQFALQHSALRRSHPWSWFCLQAPNSPRVTGMLLC